MIDRKKWLEEKIDKLADLYVQNKLTPQGKTRYESYKQEYLQILEKEREQAGGIKMTDRKEWLEKKIDYYSGLDVLGQLTFKERVWLESHQQEYQWMLDKEHEQERAIKADKSKEMKQRRGRGRYGERRLAKKVHGVVVGRSKYIAGIQIDCQRPPDVIAPVRNPLFSFESKWLIKIPKSLQKLMTQAISNCPTELIPVGVIGDREQHLVYYIVMERDWLALHVGETKEEL